MNVWFCAGSSTSSRADGGVAAEIGAELVDLVEHHDRVARAGLAELGDDAAGHGADVGPAVAADVGLVAHAAQGDADELAAHRFGDAILPSDVLPTPGGPTKQRIAPPPSGLSLRTARYSMIRRLTLSRSWWSRSRILRASARSSLSSVAIAQGSSLTIWSQVRITPYSGEAQGIASSRASSRLASFMTSSGSLAASSFVRSAFDLAGAAGLAFAQLLADRLHLLLEVVAALALVDVLLDLGLDLVLQLQHVELRREARGDHPQALLDVQLFEHAAAFRRRRPAGWRRGSRPGPTGW